MIAHGTGTYYTRRDFAVEAASLAERRRRAAQPDAVIVQPSDRRERRG